jgi:hypothetical protein
MKVFDVTVAKSFESLDNWRNEFLVQAAVGGPEHFPFVVLGNKVDQEDKRTVLPSTQHHTHPHTTHHTHTAFSQFVDVCVCGPRLQVSARSGNAWCREHGDVPFYETRCAVSPTFLCVATTPPSSFLLLTRDPPTVPRTPPTWTRPSSWRPSWPSLESPRSHRTFSLRVSCVVCVSCACRVCVARCAD